MLCSSFEIFVTATNLNTPPDQWRPHFFHFSPGGESDIIAYAVLLILEA
jgi:hypothetical protein